MKDFEFGITNLTDFNSVIDKGTLGLLKDRLIKFVGVINMFGNKMSFLREAFGDNLF